MKGKTPAAVGLSYGGGCLNHGRLADRAAKPDVFSKRERLPGGDKKGVEEKKDMGRNMQALRGCSREVDMCSRLVYGWIVAVFFAAVKIGEALL